MENDGPGSPNRSEERLGPRRWHDVVELGEGVPEPREGASCGDDRWEGVGRDEEDG